MPMTVISTEATVIGAPVRRASGTSAAQAAVPSMFPVSVTFAPIFCISIPAGSCEPTDAVRNLVL